MFGVEKVLCGTGEFVGGEVARWDWVTIYILATMLQANS